MKKILIFLSLCFVLTGCSSLESNNDSKQNGQDNVINDSVDNENSEKQKHTGDFVLSDEEVKIDKKSHLNSLFEKLTSYGNEIYNKGNYDSYQKRNEVYFLSLNDLKNDFGYDISMFKNEDGTLCDVDNSGIFFDDDKKLRIDYPNGSNPISVIIIGCE